LPGIQHLKRCGNSPNQALKSSIALRLWLNILKSPAWIKMSPYGTLVSRWSSCVSPRSTRRSEGLCLWTSADCVDGPTLQSPHLEIKLGKFHPIILLCRLRECRCCAKGRSLNVAKIRNPQGVRFGRRTVATPSTTQQQSPTKSIREEWRSASPRTEQNELRNSLDCAESAAVSAASRPPLRNGRAQGMIG
jgi:hypothetical protein